MQVFLWFLLIFSNPALAQDFSCEEIPLTLRLQGIGNTELFSILCEEEVYVSVPDLFDFLKIRNVPSKDFTRIEGYLQNQNDRFIIDTEKMELVYRENIIGLEEGDLKRTPTNLYLKSAYFEEVFQLKIRSSIRTMSIEVTPNFELPSLRLARREKLRENLRQLNTGVTSADTTLSKESSLFQLGVADWDVHLNQRNSGENFNRFDLRLGGSLAGGEFSSRLNYNSNNLFDPRNQFYRWQYINNDNPALRQISLGKIRSRSISTLFRPVVGIKLTNAPTYLKKSFGTYELSDYTKANWMVELYINGVLVDFKQADAAGFFSFDVPLMYGSTDINLHYYGPYGEEQIVERQFDIPFVFVPMNEIEYSLNGGIVEDGENTIFAQARMNYGLTRRISLGGGIEYLSSLERHPVIPFLNTAIRLPKNMLFSAEYAHNVGVKGEISFTSPSNLRLELKYAKYKEEQKAVRFTFLEEREIILSTPFNIGNVQGNSRMRIRQNILRHGSYVNPEWFLSTRVYGINLNLSTNAFFREDHEPWIFSRLSSSIMLPKHIIFTPELDFEYDSNSVSAVQGQLRKRIFRSGYLRTSYGYNFNFDQFYFNVGLKFNMHFSRFSLSGTTNGRESSFTETASGSLLLGPTSAHTSLSGRTSMDRAHVKFIAFLDVNGNGIKDNGESQLQGMEVEALSGGQKEEANDGSTLFRGMEPYMDHHFTINTDHLNRIAWRVKNKRLNIYLNPNQMRLVEIPVSVVGEVSGFVLDTSGSGIGGIRIQILDAEQQLVKEIISEPDGFFSYLGLKSNNYTAQLNPVQLENLELASNGPLDFQIRNNEEGDYIDNLKFILSDASKKEDATTKVTETSEVEQLQEITSEEKTLLETSEGGTVTGESEAEAAAVGAEGEKAGGKEELSTAQDESTQATTEKEVRNATGERVVAKEQDVDIASITASEREKALIRKGLYYKVQILTSDDLLESDDKCFKGLRNISSEKTDSGYTYTYGKTLLPFEAAALQNEMRRSGFADAYVVHYFNGQRITVEEAVSIRNGEIIPSKKISKQMQVRTEDMQPELEMKQVGLHFKVQIAASNVPLDTSDVRFKGIDGVEEYRHENMYKYSLGNFNSFGEANQYKNVLRSQGLADAFVVPFHNTKRLGQPRKQGVIFFKDSNLKGIGGIFIAVRSADGKLISKILSEVDGSFVTPNLEPGTYTLSLNAVELGKIGMRAENESVSFTISEEGAGEEKIQFVLVAMEESHAEIKDPEEGLVFKVQVLASVPKLPADHKLLRGLEMISRYRHNGLYKYTVGESDNLESMRRVQKEVRKKGFEDAFIVTFLNGTRINLQELTGHVFVKSGKEKKGIEGMSIQIFQNEKLITSLTSNRDGQFYFLGLKPGRYTVKLEEGQLQELQLRLRLSSHEFEIQRNSEGVIKQPVLFELERVEDRIFDKRTPEQNDIEYRIQLAASNVPLGPNHPTLKGIDGVKMYRHNGMYKYTVGSTSSLQEAKIILEQLETFHAVPMFIVGFEEGKRIKLLE